MRQNGYSGILPFVYVGKNEIHKYMQYEVSMTVCTGRIANQRKVPKWLPFKQYKSESLNMCKNEKQRCIVVPKMKLLCLILWLGEVCTDDTNANAGR